MSLDFRELTAEDAVKLGALYARRPNKTCDSVVFDNLLWQKPYKIRYAVSGDAVQWLMEENGVYYGAMPVCVQEELPYYFKELQDYFNDVLGKPLQIYLADEEAVEFLHLKDSPDYKVREQEDLKDYLYDADALRNLSGRKLRKKKNHINFFEKTYEGQYEYRRLDCGDREAVREFLDRWHGQKGQDTEVHLDYETDGIRGLLEHCEYLPGCAAGVFIDGKLEAFTVGSYNPLEKMAVVHVEKANPEIRGLYQFINRQFLTEEFPDAVLVNREDDMGQENLRKAKLSYDPCGYARKYFVGQIWS